MEISFGLILYNEDRLIKQQLINLYKHAHQIIIVEGRILEFGDKFPKERDSTLSIIEEFQEENDPDNKITLITRDAWEGKNDMVNVYYDLATSDYVWHIDADEFYSDDCINRTKQFIEDTKYDDYGHDEFYYYRYYNVAVAKNGKTKFWNRPARIHKNYEGRKLTHRPQLLLGSKDWYLIPREVGVRHHYNSTYSDRVKIKAHFYGYEMHARFFDTYEQPIEELIKNKVSVRPDNNGKDNSFPFVLKENELEVPNGIDKLFDYFESDEYPWTVDGYGPFKVADSDRYTKLKEEWISEDRWIFEG